MSTTYRGYSYNDQNEDPWYAREISLFKAIIGKLPDASSTLVAGQHTHNYLVNTSSGAAAVTVDSTNGITFPFQGTGALSLDVNHKLVSAVSSTMTDKYLAHYDAPTGTLKDSSAMQTTTGIEIAGNLDVIGDASVIGSVITPSVYIPGTYYESDNSNARLYYSGGDTFHISNLNDAGKTQFFVDEYESVAVMTLLNNGRVGIGGSAVYSPDAMLQVENDVHVGTNLKVDADATVASLRITDTTAVSDYRYATVNTTGNVSGQGIYKDWYQDAGDPGDASFQGWDLATVTKRVHYSFLPGKNLLVNIFIFGTSNSGYARMIMPRSIVLSADGNYGRLTCCHAADNGRYNIGRMSHVSSDEIGFFRDATSSDGGWTASGMKLVTGQIMLILA